MIRKLFSLAERQYEVSLLRRGIKSVKWKAVWAQPKKLFCTSWLPINPSFQLLLPVASSPLLYSKLKVSLFSIQCLKWLLGANIQNILSAVLVKLNTVSTLTVQQSLLLVFARLAIVDPAGLISFLEGAQATAPLLQLWLDKQADMFGAYERRVTVAGLCKLIERGCVDGDAVMGSLSYNKKVVQQTTGRQTRSKKQPDQYEQVPWLSQAMTIVSAEWATQKERDTIDEDDDDDEDYEDLDDDQEDRVEEINVGMVSNSERFWKSFEECF